MPLSPAVDKHYWNVRWQADINSGINLNRKNIFLHVIAEKSTKIVEDLEVLGKKRIFHFFLFS